MRQEDLEFAVESIKKSIKIRKKLGKNYSFEAQLLKSYQNTIKENEKKH